MNELFSRRDLLQRTAAVGALALLGTACGKEKPKALACTDTSGLAPADLQIRTTLAYEDLSTHAGKQCSGCQQFLPAAPNTCGGCKVVKGPINPAGYCNSFVAKPA